MKKLLLSLSLMQGMVAMAQTLTTSELPFAGMSYAVSEDTITNVIPGNSGQGQVWNFTQLQPQATDTITFENAAGSPYAAQFATSNLVSHEKKDSLYAYYTTDQNGFYLDGSHQEGSNPGEIHFQPVVTIIPVPFGYNDTHISHARTESNSVGSGTAFKMIIHQIDTLTADGTGSLMLPGATYNNVLRIHVASTLLDSIFVDMTGTGNYTFYMSHINRHTRYSWFRQGSPSYLLGLEMNYQNPTISERVDFVTPIPQTTGTPAITKQDEIYVYPNPANGFVNIKSEDNRLDNAMIEFYSLTDLQVVHARLKTGLNRLSMVNLNDGIYAYRIFADKKVIREGKLIIKN